MKYLKFIVVEKDKPGQYDLNCGFVEWHNDLMPKKPLNCRGPWREPNCLGGGLFEYNEFNDGRKEVWLYGESTDFGKVNKNILQKAIDQNLNDFLWEAARAVERRYWVEHNEDKDFDLDDCKVIIKDW